MRVFAFALLATILASSAALAAPRGTVILRNGTTFEGVEYEVRGTKVKVTLRFGERVFDMSEIKDFIPEGDDDDAEGEGESGPSLEDWQTRVRLTPPKGWEAASATMPLSRVRIRHSEYDATFTVTARPATGPWQAPGKRIERDVSAGIENDLGLLFAGRPKLRLDAWKMFEAPVLRTSPAKVKVYGKGGERVLTEVRFRRYGLEYGLSYSVKQEDAGALKHDVDALFQSFSFLPALMTRGGFYGDYARGFALDVPSKGWTVISSAFDQTDPLTLTSAQGRGVVRAEIEPGKTDAKEVVSTMLSLRKGRSRHMTRVTQEEATVGGYSVTRFAFDDFREHGKKLQHFEGFAAAVQGHVLMITGMSPISDEDSKKIAGEISAILASVQLYDVEGQRASMAKEVSALRYLAQGYALAGKRSFAEAVQRYTDAINEDDGVALIYYMRGRAQKGAGEFKAYQEDLERADELDPRAGYLDDLQDLSRAEGKAALQRKDFETAAEQFARSYQGTKSADDLKSMLNALGQLWGRSRKAKKFRNGVSEIEKLTRRVRDAKDVHAFLAKVYQEAANGLIKAGQKSRAKSMVSKLKKLSKKTGEKRYADAASRLDKTLSRR